MSGSKADAFENEVLKIATGQSSALTGISGTITPYLALFTGSLSGDTPGTEATGGGYARITTASKWGAPSGGSVSNNATITFAQFSGSVSAGAAFTHFGLFDAVTGGTALYYGDFTDQTKTGSNGDSIVLAIGAVTLTET
jgi:hypothetical protein